MASNYKLIHNADSTREKLTISSSAVLSFALFVISCVAIIALLKSDPVMQSLRGNIGWITCGLAAGSAFMYLISGLKDDKGEHLRLPGLVKEVIQAIILLTIGILGGLGILNADQVCYGIMGTYLISGFLSYAFAPCLISCGKSIALYKSGAINSEAQKGLLKGQTDKYRSDYSNGHSEA